MLKPHHYVQTTIGKQGEWSELKSTVRTKEKEKESVSPEQSSAGTSPLGAGGAA